jgi:cell division protein FtsN
VKTPDGTKTRVRCGPFPTPEAAQAARTKLVARNLAAGELKVVQAGQ